MKKNYVNPKIEAIGFVGETSVMGSADGNPGIPGGSSTILSSSPHM